MSPSSNYWRTQIPSKLCQWKFHNIGLSIEVSNIGLSMEGLSMEVSQQWKLHNIGL